MLNYKEIYEISRILYQNDINRDHFKMDEHFPLFFNLIHAKISNITNNHIDIRKESSLTQYNVILVELSDIAIHLINHLATFKHSFKTFVPIADLKCQTKDDFIAEIHYYISQSYYYFKEKNEVFLINSLLDALRYIILMAKYFYPEIEFKQVIHEKIKYYLKH